MLHDGFGKRAAFLRTQTIRVNFGPVNSLWFRNMVTDGRFGPITIDGRPPAQTAFMGCLQSVSTNLQPPLNRGDERTFTLECEVIDSFLESHEGLLHEVALDTKEVELQIEFPADRPCRRAFLTLEAAGEAAKTLEKPAIEKDGRLVTSRIRNPKTGFTYHLHWDW